MEPLMNSQLNIENLRLPQNYGQSLGSRKLVVNIPVGKPSKEKFFRAQPSADMTFNGYVVEEKGGGGHHLVEPSVADIMGKLARPTRLHVAIDRGDNLFLIPVPLPDESGQRNPWHESITRAIELAQSRWVRVSADRRSGSYEVFEALGNLPEPNWPELTMDAILEKAFLGKVVTDEHHPIVQALLGKT